jgi:hypothetical protein
MPELTKAAAVSDLLLVGVENDLFEGLQLSERP